MAEDERTLAERRISALEASLLGPVQGFVGSNLHQIDPYIFGQIAQTPLGDANKDYFKSDYAGKVRADLEDAAQKEAEQLGVAGNYDYSVGNGHVAAQTMKIVQSAGAMAQLGELEAVVKKAGAKLNFNVPDALKTYQPTEIFSKMDKEGKDSLSEEENDALVMYQTLMEAYSTACAVKYIDYFAEANSRGAKLSEKYEPEKKE